MNFRVLVSLIYVSFFTNVSYGQQPVHIVTFDNYPVKIETDFVCSGVIDKRDFTDNIGNIYQGIRNNRGVAKFGSGFGGVLKRQVNDLILSNTESESILLVVHEFKVEEKKDEFRELGSCEIRIEFVKQVDSHYYSLGSYFKKVNNFGLDVTQAWKTN